MLKNRQWRSGGGSIENALLHWCFLRKMLTGLSYTLRRVVAIKLNRRFLAIFITTHSFAQKISENFKYKATYKLVRSDPFVHDT